jgi:hypothetical protein
MHHDLLLFLLNCQIVTVIQRLLHFRRPLHPHSRHRIISGPGFPPLHLRLRFRHR